MARLSARTFLSLISASVVVVLAVSAVDANSVDLSKLLSHNTVNALSLKKREAREPPLENNEFDKRDWQKASGMWGKRNIDSAWLEAAKRGWEKGSGLWGKRGDSWTKASGMWGKRSLVKDDFDTYFNGAEFGPYERK